MTSRGVKDTSDDTRVYFKIGEYGIAVVAGIIVGKTEEGGGDLIIPLNGYVLKFKDAEKTDLGDKVVWVSPSSTPDLKIMNGMQGGPIVLSAGVVNVNKSDEDFNGTAPPVTFSQDETFDSNLLPRMVAGVDKDDYVILAAVDGRDIERPGMTLKMCGELMKCLGCVYALNLDGGSSKRMIVGGQVMDNTSTEVRGGGESKDGGERVRGLKTAIVIRRREEDR
ncbi:hypothetical protein TrCOL_g1082 [Triparma columacea]|uniref:Phosphodiester glycosidase domain-containing protein n=1 Tax=Triparma columacea TaxID=722753 RepID=A0A9W7G2B6_9STRA|nr:hypothetical protein TrCOL_g1082 [Triparma columacea]